MRLVQPLDGRVGRNQVSLPAIEADGTRAPEFVPGPAASSAGWSDAIGRVVHTEGRYMRAGVVCGLLLAATFVSYFAVASAPHAGLAVERIPFVVVTDPPGAEVWLDEALMGTTTDNGRLRLELETSNTETRWIEVRHAGYKSTRRPVSAFSGMEGTVVKLYRKPIDLLVETVPSGAEVWRGETLLGFGPLTTRIIPDGDKPIAFTARQPGYKSVDRAIQLADVAGLRSIELRLPALPPELDVVSTPPGAMVVMDGRRVGRTPVHLTLDESVRGKRIRLAAELSKHDPIEQAVEVPTRPGKTISAQFAMKPSATRLVIETAPPGAQLTLNGRPLGVSPFTATLSDDEAQQAQTVEALLPGSHFGRRILPVVEAHTTVNVQMPLEFFARKVVFALDTSARGPEEFELQRGRIKEQIHDLNRDQKFALIVFENGRALVGPEPEPTAASSAQKIRAYDRLDGLRWVAAEDDPVGLLRAALKFKPDSVWLYVRAPIEQLGWLAATQKQAHPTAIQVVAGSRDADKPWLREWLSANRGTLMILGEDLAVANVTRPRR